MSFPYISAAVVADDGQAYVFSGHYYWKLNLKSGISKDYAELIINRWPRAPTDMDAAFTVADRNQQFSTVFIKEDKWYSYRKYKLLQSGNTRE
jgi:hypothetical protein